MTVVLTPRVVGLGPILERELRGAEASSVRSGPDCRVGEAGLGAGSDRGEAVSGLGVGASLSRALAIMELCGRRGVTNGASINALEAMSCESVM
jgi:hypothetical protein